MSHETLRELAASARRLMRDEPERRIVHHRHARGMEWVFERQQNGWRLAMAREDAFPSGMEVMILRNAFDVPVAADEVRRMTTYRGRSYHVVEFSWVERVLFQQRALDL